tara:strand:- start:1539 stop:4004 length:2466 start_codon:yes stop_codon:yes gene_type:complete
MSINNLAIYNPPDYADDVEDDIFDETLVGLINDSSNQTIAVHGEYVVLGRTNRVTLHNSTTMEKIHDMDLTLSDEFKGNHGKQILDGDDIPLHRTGLYRGYAVGINSRFAFAGYPDFDNKLEGLIYRCDLETNSVDWITKKGDKNPRGLGKSLAVTEEGVLSGAEGITGHRCGIELITFNAADGTYETYKELAHDFANNFGFSVALSGTIGVVGEYGANKINIFLDIVNTNNANGGRGKDPHPDAISVIPDTIRVESEYGYSLALEDSTLIVGDPGSRKVYAYTINKITGEIVETHILESLFNDRFGHSVSISNNVVVVGAPTTKVQSVGADAGKVYIYRYESNKLIPYDVESMEGIEKNQRFGNSVSIHDDKVAIYSKTGAYVYKMEPPIYFNVDLTMTFQNITVNDFNEDVKNKLQEIIKSETTGAKSVEITNVREGSVIINVEVVFFQETQATELRGQLDEPAAFSESILQKMTKYESIFGNVSVEVEIESVEVPMTGYDGNNIYPDEATTGIPDIYILHLEDKWHDGLVDISARVPYENEHDVIIYTLSQGTTEYVGIQPATPLRKLDVSIPKSEMMNFQGGPISITISTLSKTVTDTFYYYGYSEAGADPYIQPVQGKLYKLPDSSACYRLLQTENVMINACVEQIDQNYINDKLRSLSQTQGVTLDIYNFVHMFFFTKLCIIKDDECAIYDMLKQQFQQIPPSWIKEESGKNRVCHIEMYTTESVQKSTTLYINGEIVIESACYENPQVMTGIKLFKYPPSSDGLLLRKCSSRSAKIESIYTNTQCIFTEALESTFVDEIFHSNGESKTYKMEIV